MIETTPRENQLIFAIHVSAGSRRNEVGGQHDGALRVAVTQAPEKGKANAAIIKLLAKTLGISKSQLEIISGDTHRRKTIAATQIDPQQIDQQLQTLATIK
ncbi:hypothetical protein CA51_49180 [Rosistilla oblonga]|uniref:UPF0235 protein Mal33_28450 n=1 Tax=Rosistilla oblonga TaxID=2527990 RepID=A0A518IUS5_9BACT|nr:DUF167 domain-containing protein [Rosistilla oblonga]QDV15008.1 hypothetical protein CA51_49180 [Rosistilla oblonga]QDV56844.1 hypothetical protein Mal33_28450 [Rosistilla oblonga]